MGSEMCIRDSGINNDRIVEAKQFAWDTESEDFVEVATFEGSDI